MLFWFLLEVPVTLSAVRWAVMGQDPTTVMTVCTTTTSWKTTPGEMPQQDTWSPPPGGSSWELPQFTRGRMFHGLPPEPKSRCCCTGPYTLLHHLNSETDTELQNTRFWSARKLQRSFLTFQGWWGQTSYAHAWSSLLDLSIPLMFDAPKLHFPSRKWMIFWNPQSVSFPYGKAAGPSAFSLLCSG